MQIIKGIRAHRVNSPNINNKLQKNSAKTVSANGNFPVMPKKLTSLAQKSDAAMVSKLISL